MDIQRFSHLFSRQYCLFEDTVFYNEKYLSFEEDNFNAYSVEMCSLILSICGEISVSLKELCTMSNLLNNNKPNMYNFRETINKEFVFFKEEEVTFIESRIRLKPWGMWAEEKSPSWWDAYNGIKHNRGGVCKASGKEFYKLANLENLLNSLAALYIVNYYCLANYPDVNEKIAEKYLLSFASKRCEMTRWQGCVLGFMGSTWFEFKKMEELRVIAQSKVKNQG